MQVTTCTAVTLAYILCRILYSTCNLSSYRHPCHLLTNISSGSSIGVRTDDLLSLPAWRDRYCPDSVGNGSVWPWRTISEASQLSMELQCLKNPRCFTSCFTAAPWSLRFIFPFPRLILPPADLSRELMPPAGLKLP